MVDILAHQIWNFIWIYFSYSTTPIYITRTPKNASRGEIEIVLVFLLLRSAPFLPAFQKLVQIPQFHIKMHCRDLKKYANHLQLLFFLLHHYLAIFLRPKIHLFSIRNDMAKDGYSKKIFSKRVVANFSLV